jgi:hypothetical protein
MTTMERQVSSGRGNAVAAGFLAGVLGGMIGGWLTVAEMWGAIAVKGPPPSEGTTLEAWLTAWLLTSPFAMVIGAPVGALAGILGGLAFGGPVHGTRRRKAWLLGVVAGAFGVSIVMTFLGSSSINNPTAVLWFLAGTLAAMPAVAMTIAIFNGLLRLMTGGTQLRRPEDGAATGRPVDLNSGSHGGTPT